MASRVSLRNLKPSACRSPINGATAEMKPAGLVLSLSLFHRRFLKFFHPEMRAISHFGRPGGRALEDGTKWAGGVEGVDTACGEASKGRHAGGG